MADVKEFSKEVKVSVGALVFSAIALVGASYVLYDLQAISARMDKRYERQQEKINEYDILLEEYDERLDDLEYEMTE